MKEKLYQHYKNGLNYKIVEECLLQENGKWIDGVIYISEKAGLEVKFVRSKEEFNLKFKEVE